MTIKVNRLARILSNLTVEQRFDTVLAAYRQDWPLTLSVSYGLAQEEAERWDRMVGLLGATHSHLGWYVSYVEATTTQVELRLGILLGLHLAFLNEEQRLWDLALDPDAEDQRAEIRKRMNDLEEKVTALAGLIAEQLIFRWLEVRIAEIGGEALAQECSGRDILHPDTKATLASCKGRLLGVQKGLKEWAEVELPEPEDAQVEHLLALLEQEAER